MTENPKEAAGRIKAQLHLLSPSAMTEIAKVLQHGAEKYGARNYRDTKINATTYVSAIMRHLLAWNDGEDLDPESGLSHIAHVAACCDILLDTAACGMLTDDRSKKVPKKLSSEEIRKKLGVDTYTGHTLCGKCGTIHWRYGSCPPPASTSGEPKSREPVCSTCGNRCWLHGGCHAPGVVS